MPQLSEDEIRSGLSSVPAWVRDGTRIRRSFEFGNFREALAFVVHVGCLAEKADHHPDIDIRYRVVQMALWTHTEDGLTRKDFDLAKRIDAIAPSP